MIRIIEHPDWIEMFVDGRLVYEGHNLSPQRLLTLLNIDYDYDWNDGDDDEDYE